MCRGPGIGLGFVSLGNIKAVSEAEAVSSMGKTGKWEDTRADITVSVETG